MSKRRPVWSDYTSVYFLRRVSDGLIKIGCSANVEKRIRQVRTAGGHDVEWLGCLPYAKETQERQIQKQFTRARVIGEWFNPTPELLSFIRENAEPLLPPRREGEVSDFLAAAMHYEHEGRYLLRVAERLKKRYDDELAKSESVSA